MPRATATACAREDSWASTSSRSCVAAQRRRRRRRRQPPLAVARQAHVGRVEPHAVPELASHLFVLLVQALAIVGELATPHQMTIPQADLPKPVRIGQRLARGADEVGLAALQDALSLLEGADAAAGDDGRVAAGLDTPVVTSGTLRPKGPRS